MLGRSSSPKCACFCQALFWAARQKRSSNQQQTRKRTHDAVILNVGQASDVIGRLWRNTQGLSNCGGWAGRGDPGVAACDRVGEESWERRWDLVGAGSVELLLLSTSPSSRITFISLWCSFNQSPDYPSTSLISVILLFSRVRAWGANEWVVRKAWARGGWEGVNSSFQLTCSCSPPREISSPCKIKTSLLGFVRGLWRKWAKRRFTKRTKNQRKTHILKGIVTFFTLFLISKFLQTWNRPWFSFTMKPSFGIGSSCSCFLSENMGGSEKEWKN